MDEPHITDDLRQLVRLLMVEGIGPRLRQNLLAAFGTPERILTTPPGDLQRVDGIGPKLAHQIAVANETIDVDAEIRLAHDHQVDMVTDRDDCYPRLLREIHDPPDIFYCRGNVQQADNLSIAIVGTRHATHYGKNQAQLLARDLAKAGLTIVSGLARGIDAAAHRAALAAGGRTIAVLASGLLNIYPPEHKELADEIAGNGYLISEAPMRRVPIGGAFPQRNRIISGLSLGTIVIEAAERSGALITARHAYEQGREVFALPGPIDSRMSQGCHALIRDGATLVQTADDVLDQLGPLVDRVETEAGQVVHHPAELKLNEIETQVLQAIETSPTSIDLVTRNCGLPVQRVLATVSVLEMRHLVRRVSGTHVARR